MSTGFTGRSSSFRRFGQVLALPGARRFFVPAAVARWGVAMSGPAVFWTVHAGSGSLAQAGVATGGFSAAEALAGPQIARLVDRFGQRTVMGLSTAGFLAAGLALTGVRGWAMVGLAILMGATVPPVGALSAVRWRPVAGPKGLLAAALSLESALNECTFLVGPILVTSLPTPWPGLFLILGLVGIGMTGLLTARATEPAPVPRTPGLLDRRFLGLFAVNLAMGLFFGGIGVAIATFTLAHDAAALAGAVTATGGVVSLFAGMAYGSMRDARPVAVMFGAGLTIAVGCAGLALVPNLAGLFLGYAIVGGCVALVLIPSAVLLQEVVHPGAVTQALTWINSASAIGVATAAPVIGLVAERGGWRAGFLVLAALSALTPVTVLLLSRYLPRVAFQAQSTSRG